GRCSQLVLNVSDELIVDLALDAEDKDCGIVLLALGQCCGLDIDASIAQDGADDTQSARAVAVGEEQVAASSAHVHAAAIDAHNLFYAIDTGQRAFKNRGLAFGGNGLDAHRGVVTLGLILGGDLDGYAAGFSNRHGVDEGDSFAGDTREET